MRVLVISYMISSKRGSEYSVAWNHVKHLSERFDLSVVIGATGDHMGDFIADSDLDNLPIQKIWVKPGLFIRCLNYLNRKGLFKYSFYWAYKAWQRKALSQVKKQVHEIDLIHVLNPIGFREPGFWYKLETPLIWGPIGGFPYKSFRTESSYLFAFLWNTANYFNRRRRRVRKTILGAGKVYAATSENAEIIKSLYDINAVHLFENGIVDNTIRLNSDRFKTIEVVQIVWIGSMERRKRLKYFLNAIEALNVRASIVIHVVGVAKQDLNHRINGNTEFKFYGKLNREKVYEIFDKAHLHIVTSTREGNPTTIWEAAARGVPTISSKNSGMKDSISLGLGLLIDTELTPEQFASELRKVIDHPERIFNMHKSVLLALPDLTWSKRLEFWTNEYYNIASKI